MELEGRKVDNSGDNLVKLWITYPYFEDLELIIKT